MPLARWLVWTAQCDAKSGFARDDPLPLARAAAYRTGRFIARRSAAALAHWRG
jgi:hypothetical protein